MPRFDTRFNKFLVLCAVILTAGVLILNAGLLLLGYKENIDTFFQFANGLTLALFALMRNDTQHPTGEASDPVAVKPANNKPLPVTEIDPKQEGDNSDDPS